MAIVRASLLNQQRMTDCLPKRIHDRTDVQVMRTPVCIKSELGYTRFTVPGKHAYLLVPYLHAKRCHLRLFQLVNLAKLCPSSQALIPYKRRLIDSTKVLQCLDLLHAVRTLLLSAVLANIDVADSRFFLWS